LLLQGRGSPSGLWCGFPDHIIPNRDCRPNFIAIQLRPASSMLAFRERRDRCKADGISIVLVENASRFARDLAVQLTGHAMMRQLGIELIPVDAPTHFTDPTPTAEMVRQILGAVSQFEKASLVAKLRHARDRIRAEQGRCEGRKAVPAEVVALAKRLARVSPKTGKRRSLRAIAAELAAVGYTQPSGHPYLAGSIKCMLEYKPIIQAKAAA
jgi:DNA invertase Pin-like site-specific DNA recombinase